jgi:hypothetical protein
LAVVVQLTADAEDPFFADVILVLLVGVVEVRLQVVEGVRAELAAVTSNPDELFQLICGKNCFFLVLLLTAAVVAVFQVKFFI